MQSAIIYWDGVTANWSTTSAWSTASGATTPNPGVFSGSAGDVIFNITTANAASSNVSMAGGNRDAKSLTFNTSGTTNVRAGGSSGVLADQTIGTGGITVSAGTVVIGDTPTSFGTVTVGLAAS